MKVTQRESLAKLPMEEAVIICITKEIGWSVGKRHAKFEAFLRHLPKPLRPMGREILVKFKREGIIAKHRTNTFSWSVNGRDFAKRYLATASTFVKWTKRAHSEGKGKISLSPLTCVTLTKRWVKYLILGNFLQAQSGLLF